MHLWIPKLTLLELKMYCFTQALLQFVNHSCLPELPRHIPHSQLRHLTHAQLIPLFFNPNLAILPKPWSESSLLTFLTNLTSTQSSVLIFHQLPPYNYLPKLSPATSVTLCYPLHRTHSCACSQCGRLGGCGPPWPTIILGGACLRRPGTCMRRAW